MAVSPRANAWRLRRRLGPSRGHRRRARHPAPALIALTFCKAVRVVNCAAAGWQDGVVWHDGFIFNGTGGLVITATAIGAGAVAVAGTGAGASAGAVVTIICTISTRKGIYDG